MDNLKKPIQEWTAKEMQEYAIAIKHNCKDCVLDQFCRDNFFQCPDTWEFRRYIPPKFTEQEQYMAQLILDLFSNRYTTIYRNSIGWLYLQGPQSEDRLINNECFKSIKECNSFELKEIANPGGDKNA